MEKIKQQSVLASSAKNNYTLLTVSFGKNIVTASDTRERRPAAVRLHGGRCEGFLRSLLFYING